MCTRVWCIVVGFGVASKLVLWSPVGAPAGVPGPRRNADDCDAGWFAPVATRRRPMLRPLGLRRGLAVSARGETPRSPPLGLLAGEISQYLPGVEILRSPPLGSLAGEISQYLPGVEILRSPHWVAGWGDLAVSARGEDPPEAPTWVAGWGDLAVSGRRRPPEAPIGLLAGGISQYLPGG